VVVSALKDWTCAECSGTGDLLIMEDAGPICMTCADLDHLVFLASGDAALSRRAKKASKLCAVVVRFSRARRRYERQGILVEEDALARAEAECSRPTMPP
jgi:ribosomal protein L14